MSTADTPVGVDHPTTVPANFDPESFDLDSEYCPDCETAPCEC